MVSFFIFLIAVYLLIVVYQGNGEALIQQLKQDSSTVATFVISFLALIFLLNIPEVGDIVAVIVDISVIALAIENYKVVLDVIDVFKKLLEGQL